MPGLLLVDTPGLGSALPHNTEATRAWLPNVAAAIVAISSERPLSDEDLRLVAEARQTAPRVVVLLSKVDPLSAEEREQVLHFMEHKLFEKFAAEIEVLPFSSRVDTERWLCQLRERILLPIAGDVPAPRRCRFGPQVAATGRIVPRLPESWNNRGGAVRRRSPSAPCRRVRRASEHRRPAR